LKWATILEPCPVRSARLRSSPKNRCNKASRPRGRRHSRGRETRKEGADTFPDNGEFLCDRFDLFGRIGMVHFGCSGREANPRESHRGRSSPGPNRRRLRLGLEAFGRGPPLRVWFTRHAHPGLGNCLDRWCVSLPYKGIESYLVLHAPSIRIAMSRACCLYAEFDGNDLRRAVLASAASEGGKCTFLITSRNSVASALESKGRRSGLVGRSGRTRYLPGNRSRHRDQYSHPKA